MQYKPLAPVFESKGFHFSLIKREGDIAIYKRWKDKYISIRGNEKCAHFEVTKIKRHAGYELAGNKIEPAETYPSSSAWGIDGFTYTSLERAEKKFEELKK